MTDGYNREDTGVVTETRQTPPLRLRTGNEWSERRVRRGLSMRQLERLSGIPRGTISLIERGRVIPTPSEASKLLAHLSQDPDGLTAPGHGEAA